VKILFKTLLLFIIFLVGNYIYKTLKIDEETVNYELSLPLEVTLSKNNVKQGEYINIVFNNIDGCDFKIETDICSSLNLEIYKLGDKAYAYIPVSIFKPKGIYSIKIFNNNLLFKEYKITVIETKFEEQNLTISEEIVKNTRNNNASKEFTEAIIKARSYHFRGKLYEDIFIVPVKGEITTEFGVKRYINGSNTPTRHYGIDIANEKGTPIKAFATGIVTYAGFLTSAGNYIVIDHGMGLLSYYAHFEKLVVKTMEMVKQGDIIGYMGSTGFSTGSHLHFALTFRETYTDPWQFFKREDVEEKNAN